MELWVLQIIVSITTLTTAIVISAMLLLQKKKRRHRNRISSVASPLQHRLVVQRLLNTLTARPSVQGRGLRVVFVGRNSWFRPTLSGTCEGATKAGTLSADNFNKEVSKIY